MTNHVYYSSIDKEMIPASMSRNVMGILRNADYKGLVLSDSIRMGALTTFFTGGYYREIFFKWRRPDFRPIKTKGSSKNSKYIV